MSLANASMTPEGFPSGGGGGARGPGSGFFRVSSAVTFLVVSFASADAETLGATAGFSVLLLLLLLLLLIPAPGFPWVVEVGALAASGRAFVVGLESFRASWPYDEKLGSGSRSRLSLLLLLLLPLGPKPWCFGSPSGRRFQPGPSFL